MLNISIPHFLFTLFTQCFSYTLLWLTKTPTMWLRCFLNFSYKNQYAPFTILEQTHLLSSILCIYFFILIFVYLYLKKRKEGETNFYYFFKLSISYLFDCSLLYQSNTFAERKSTSLHALVIALHFAWKCFCFFGIISFNKQVLIFQASRYRKLCSLDHLIKFKSL